MVNLSVIMCQGIASWWAICSTVHLTSWFYKMERRFSTIHAVRSNYCLSIWALLSMQTLPSSLWTPREPTWFAPFQAMVVQGRIASPIPEWNRFPIPKLVNSTGGLCMAAQSGSITVKRKLCPFQTATTIHILTTIIISVSIWAITRRGTGRPGTCPRRFSKTATCPLH